ncbi:monovalent cation/H(+) antiporter subunit G [Pseudonocardia parietis]|uniref:Multicomponent Na+:H+ antiporter subunit G n=1 Tax=Pseudonocardia parietis TaxID=570936 RepID=A0ABS4W1S1_9PSEU|nr:monovalent cation/H(+) antiporter subunit G [Pseudonocardia parietis]MBP2370155.1 multicomponent Na+:H+ antiporter subunit G [Pseudonocardia parietis]
MPISDVVSAALMLIGATSCLLGALGLVRLPDLPARLQATTKPQTLGLLLILIAAAIRLDFENSSTLALVVLFQVLTAPVISQVVGRSAYRSGAIDRDSLVVDDLADRMDADARAVRTWRPAAPGGPTGESAGSPDGDGEAGSGDGAPSRGTDGLADR